MSIHNLRIGTTVITRRGVLLIGGISLFVVHPLSRGQRPPTIRRVGLLAIGSNTSATHLSTAFIEAMLELGWAEGKNVEYRFVYAEGEATRLTALTRELIEQKVDVIVLGAAAAAYAAQRATKTVPIVMAGVANAVGAGFVASLAKPGGNITGITSQQAEVLGKLIGILHDVTPDARRVAIMLNEANPVHHAYWTAAQSACASLHLTPLRVVANAPEQLVTAVGEIVMLRSQAVVVVADAAYQNARVKLQELMDATRLPVAYGWREHVTAGGLLSYGADLAATYRHAAKYVDKILRGVKPEDLAVEQPTKFELIINLKTAKSLGLTIPQAMLLRADEVFQ